MPSAEKHVAQAKHNSEFFNAIDCAKFSDWGATTLFYVAVQLIDAYLASQTPAFHPTNHSERDVRVSTDPNLRPIYRSYRKLKDYSRDARYAPPTRFKPEFLLRQLRDGELAAIHAEIRKHVSSV